MHKLLSAAIALGLAAASVTGPMSSAFAAPAGPLKDVSGLAVPAEQVTAKLAAAGFERIEHRLSYAKQAFVFRAFKPA